MRYDLGGVILSKSLAEGKYIELSGDPKLLSTYKRSAAGYPYIDTNDVDYPYVVKPTKSFNEVSGGYYVNDSFSIIPGMSGGPVFSYPNGGTFLVAVLVASIKNDTDTSPVATGVRIVDSDVVDFVEDQLK